jgi:hypothetical protein
MQKTLYFAHNALMNYATDETKRAIMSIKDIDKIEFLRSLEQAAEGSFLENIVYTHLLQGASKSEKVFRYRDPEARKIDAVIIDRNANTLKLIEIKSKSKISENTAVLKDGKNLFNADVLKHIGIDNTFDVSRVIVYKGKTSCILGKESTLLLVNIEDLLDNHKVLGAFLDKILLSAKQQQLEVTEKPFPGAKI